MEMRGLDLVGIEEEVPCTICRPSTAATASVSCLLPASTLACQNKKDSDMIALIFSLDHVSLFNLCDANSVGSCIFTNIQRLLSCPMIFALR